MTTNKTHFVTLRLSPQEEQMLEEHRKKNLYRFSSKSHQIRVLLHEAINKESIFSKRNSETRMRTTDHLKKTLLSLQPY